MKASKSQTIVLGILVGLLFISVVVGLISNLVEDPEQDTYQAAQAQADSLKKAMIDNSTVDATSLVLSFEYNEVAATQKYFGNELWVKGEISDIGIDIVGQVYITLAAHYKNGFREVQCLFSSGKEVASRYKGEQVVVHGICQGLMMNVVLTKCEFVE